MERQYISENTHFPGYDTLIETKKDTPPRAGDDWSFSPNSVYDAYHRIHKVFVGEGGGQKLERIAAGLHDEWLPRYLNAGGWAAAEAALVQEDQPASHRIDLLNKAENCWERALVSQEQLHKSELHEWAHENSAPYRLALNLAFTPLMKSLVVGNITDKTIERTFADTLAVAQAATVQRHLAFAEKNDNAVGDFIGFGHECTALLTLLHMNDPRHVPLPSTARAGAGYEYGDQTHDIVVVNQHWGNILKVVPVEIKARASRRDHLRYKALIVRGKLHLSIEGKYLPEHTHNAFANIYEGMSHAEDHAIVDNATSTMKELLQLYQKGRRLHNGRKDATLTHFYEKTSQ